MFSIEIVIFIFSVKFVINYLSNDNESYTNDKGTFSSENIDSTNLNESEKLKKKGWVRVKVLYAIIRDKAFVIQYALVALVLILSLKSNLTPLFISETNFQLAYLKNSPEINNNEPMIVVGSYKDQLIVLDKAFIRKGYECKDDTLHYLKGSFQFEDPKDLMIKSRDFKETKAFMNEEEFNQEKERRKGTKK